MAAPRPFRFGVQVIDLPPDRWRERARRIEALGYSSVLFPDHLGTQWDPLVGLAAVAAATRRLRVGSLVCGVDFRHPAIYAKAAATLQIVSGGRHEFGLGAGWMRSEYEQAGIAFHPPGERVDRLEEALAILRSLWEKPATSFEGRHYRIAELERAAPLPDGAAPRLIVGGGGRRVLSLAGRHADIASINPRMRQGAVTRGTLADLSPDSLRRKIDTVHAAAAAAGRDPAQIELNVLVFAVALRDRPAGVREALARRTGLRVEDVVASPKFLTGSASEIRDQLERRREQTGISYVVILGDSEGLIEQFAEAVVEPLAGS